jgi:hypothetical protein
VWFSALPPDTGRYAGVSQPLHHNVRSKWQGDQASPIFVCIFLDLFFVGFFWNFIDKGCVTVSDVGLEEKQRH